MAYSFQPIRPLLQTGSSALSRWFSYIGLCVGVLLLLCSLQMYHNMQYLFREAAIHKNGYDFISVTKKITNATMGQPGKNLFRPEEVAEVERQPFVEDAAPLLANDFRVDLSAGSVLSFRTGFFLETLENEFLDTLPPTFAWQPGQVQIPIILSSDFMEIYNVFAPGYGLPQVSRETAMGIPVYITCEGAGREQLFQG
ncbi:MAG TPA: hypothetical protein VHK69_11085, partial [Chitinophagaceae bacterium]|nr:hypothetical protein [Chitinophagaceae bacterium]